MLDYYSKPYILKTPQAYLLEKNHDDSLTGYFGVKKTLERHSRWYYWPKMRVDVEKYIQSCNIWMSSKAQRHKHNLSLLTSRKILA